MKELKLSKDDRENSYRKSIIVTAFKIKYPHKTGGMGGWQGRDKDTYITP